MRAPEHGRCRRALFTAAFSALGMLVLSSNSTAGDWRVLPRLNLLETYTDNVRLGGVGGGVGAFGGGGMQEGISLPRSIPAWSSEGRRPATT
ncbi:hypothetical protein SAMN05216299_102104 [Nitrosospira sp. Nsp14]|nr:hypothetical protein SAMN05216299_102104 [Nitrosospira sp. Nsp14]